MKRLLRMTSIMQLMTRYEKSRPIQRFARIGEIEYIIVVVVDAVCVRHLVLMSIIHVQHLYMLRVLVVRVCVGVEQQ